MSTAPLWAAYLELVLGDGETRKRRQWIFIPPVPTSIALQYNMRPVSHPSFYYREQDRMEHKSQWGHTMLSNGAMVTQLITGIDEAERRLWVAHPVITCEIDPTEMSEIQERWVTPYRLINRLTRVAKSKHNYAI